MSQIVDRRSLFRNVSDLPFLQWFAAPNLARPDLHRRARALWMVSWPFFAIVAVVLGLAVLADPDTLERRAITVAFVGGLIAFIHLLSRAGRPTLASWILVLGLSAIVTQRAWITGGIHAPVSVFYVLFIVMAGVLLGMRGGVATAVVCFFGAIALTIGTAFEWLVVRPGAGSPLSGFIFVVLSIALALVMVSLASRPLREELDTRAQMLIHDMRSPLQSLIAHLQLLRNEVDVRSVANVDGAIDGATTLHQMATSLHDAGRLSVGQMPVTRSVADLSALAMTVVSGARVLQPLRNIEVETRGDPRCNCDAELTRRIIQNLVSNATTHTDVAAPVRVVIWGSKDRVSIAVNDEGPGIAPALQTQILRGRGADGRHSARAGESMAFGLSFCKMAAEAQGGAIRIEQRKPRGSVFVVDLPR